MRLNAYIARSGIASRRGADALIESGRVTVNGTPAALGATVDPERDAVAVDGKRIVPIAASVTVLVNKPAGYLVSRRDPHHRRTVYDLLPVELAHLVPVGRLDLDSEGALLLSDDGALVERLTHPRYGAPKTYRAVVAGRMVAEALDRLRRGVVVDGERTSPAEARIVGTRGDETEVEIVLREGRKRQVRRMCEAIGHPVRALRRTSFAGLTLDGLAPGKWRRLDAEEIAALGAPGTKDDR